MQLRPVVRKKWVAEYRPMWGTRRFRVPVRDEDGNKIIDYVEVKK